MSPIVERLPAPASSSGATLVPAASGLPLIEARLRVEARGGMARVVCEQRFANRHPEPLHVTYSLPLPADAAVSGFAFRIGERRVVGEIDRRAAARERFEEAIASGRTAALLDQERSSLFTQELGNVPPGAEVVAEVVLDQRLIWNDGGWEWRFPTTVVPRYLGQPGRVNDPSQLAQIIAEGDVGARVTLALSVGDALPEGPPSSPSHALSARTRAEGAEVELVADGGVRLDRDLVVRWKMAAPAVGVTLDIGRAAAGPLAADAHGLVTIVPPAVRVPTLPRDLVVLLDTSGSMDGEPLEQARRVVLALLDTLQDRDQLELVEFSTRARRWKKHPERATGAALNDARAWLRALRAGGATEMSTAIVEALSPLRPDAQRQVVLVTDGAIGFETEVLAAICRNLPAGSRLHTVGVGSSVNRSLTAPAARAGRGAEVVIGLGEDPEPAAERLVARTRQPVLVNVELSGSALLGQVPSRVPDLFAGAPLLVGVKLASHGGELVVRGVLGGGEHWERRLSVPATAPGSGTQAHLAWYGRELVEDLELELAAGGAARDLDARIEAAGLAHRIATRLTSWIAASEDPTVDPTAPQRRVRMPHELPHGTSLAGLGLRPARFFAAAGVPAPMAMASSPPRSRIAAPAPAAAAPAPPTMLGRVLGWLGGAEESDGAALESQAPMGGVSAREYAPDDLEVDGKILLRKPRALAIGVTVPSDAFRWQPGERVRVIFADGTELLARVDAARTTAAGSLALGQTLRLWLELDADLPAADPRRVLIDAGAEPLIVNLTT